MSNFNRFIIIDDDPTNNMIVQLTLKKFGGIGEIKTFTSAVDALAYINIYNTETSSADRAVILLDINMPVMSGWEFLDQFEAFDHKIKENYKIYMLTSSIDNNDIARGKKNKNVNGYLVKPLTKEKIPNLLN